MMKFIKKYILKTPAEIQCGLDRQKWAEGLIRQLPSYHNGRCSWLINYGVSDEAVELRKNHSLNPQFSEKYNAVA